MPKCDFNKAALLLYLFNYRYIYFACIIKNEQNQPLEVFCRKGVLRNFASLTGKHLCQSLFLIKVAALLKKKTLVQVLSCEFCEISKITFFTKHLWATASE